MGATRSSLLTQDVVVVGIKVGAQGRRRYFLAPRDAPVYRIRVPARSTPFDRFPLGEGVHALIGSGAGIPLTFVGVGGEMTIDQVYSLVVVAKKNGYSIATVTDQMTDRDREAIFRGVKIM